MSALLLLLLPVIVLASVLALPFVDLVLAVFRRVRHGRSPFAPDKQHLHHRLLEMGHTHRRAVLLLYFWSALLSFGGVGLSFEGGQWVVLSVLCILAAVGLLVSVLPRRQRRAAAAPSLLPTHSAVPGVTRMDVGPEAAGAKVGSAPNTPQN